MKNKITLINLIKDSILLTAGILSAGMGLKGFLLPNEFLDGGATGIALLIHLLADIELWIVLIIINIPFIILGYNQISRIFAIKAMLAIGGLAFCLVFIPYPIITSDKLLISVFGGFFLGLGIGLAIRGGGVLDGTEVLAIYLSRKTSLKVGDIIMIINILVFSASAFLLSIETALYAILTYLAASKTIDFVIHGIEEYTAITVISEKGEEIADMIGKKLGRGVTIFLGETSNGKRGHHSQEIKIIYCVVTRLEVTKLRHEIDEIDSEAFLIQHSVDDTKGGMIKKRAFH